jgi:hypothetical protein
MKKESRWSIWFFTDIVVSIVNLAGIAFLSKMTAYDLVENGNKYLYNYTVVVVSVVTWFRFFVFYLIIPRLSKLIITLIQIIEDTLSFTFLMSLVLIIFGTAFTTRF